MLYDQFGLNLTIRIAAKYLTTSTYVLIPFDGGPERNNWIFFDPHANSTRIYGGYFIRVSQKFDMDNHFVNIFFWQVLLDMVIEAPEIG